MIQNSHQPITDRLGRVIAVLAPAPEDISYQESAKKASQRMITEAEHVHFEADELKDVKRGEFHALNIGLAYGNGHTKPTNRALGRFEDLAKKLLEDVDIQRLASYQDGMLCSRSSKKKNFVKKKTSLATYALWHPNAYRYYNTYLNKLGEVYPQLNLRLFPKSIMPSVAFNLGKRVATKKHVDSQNCPFGWCLITALGEFDATKGGHLILWDLGILIEFPAGACICLPSALITHSNIPTATNESRMSFTQYCGGEIFRHIENGFRTDKDLKKKDPAILLYRKEIRKRRIEDGYNMFSKIEDLMQSWGKKRMEL